MFENNSTIPNSDMSNNSDNFRYFLEQFADIKIMAFPVNGFEDLSIQQKRLIYYLSKAALSGRDIIFDQNFAHNLRIRKMLEEIYHKYRGPRTSSSFEAFVHYLKRVWFSNGIHHHYSADKFIPGFETDYLSELILQSGEAEFPLLPGQNKVDFISEMSSMLFDPSVFPKRISLDTDGDLITASSANFYKGVTQKEAEGFYDVLKNESDERPVSWGLNSRLIKEDDTIKEEVYRVGGLYGEPLKHIVYWLEQAAEVAESSAQKTILLKLVEFYKTGSLKTYDEFNVLWVKELRAEVDFVNGFTEVYGDPLGMKATWESVVSFVDKEASRRTKLISAYAQWFEDHSPVDARFKKKEVKGVSAKVITVAQLGGDCYPSTPIGINLPNADWIRKEHGSKSVTMENITFAYDKASQGNGLLEEFCNSQEEVALARKYGVLGGNLHTDLHECLGHGSGQLLPGTSPEALLNYSSVLEEARADLFALYYVMDEKLVELAIVPSFDVARTEYNSYIRNGLITQLVRIEEGKNIEQAHMRNRQLIAKWCYEKGRSEGIIEVLRRDGKTFCTIHDYSKLRGLFAVLLSEVQRIKSEGDYDAGKTLVETYGVKIDSVLHREVKARFSKLNIAPYGGFVNPEFELVEEDGSVIDVQISYPENYTAQMLKYSDEYSYL